MLCETDTTLCAATITVMVVSFISTIAMIFMCGKFIAFRKEEAIKSRIFGLTLIQMLLFITWTGILTPIRLLTRPMGLITQHLYPILVPYIGSHSYAVFLTCFVCVGFCVCVCVCVCFCFPCFCVSTCFFFVANAVFFFVVFFLIFF